MNRQIAFAYGIAGLAVAVAFIAVIGSTSGLFDRAAPDSASVSPTVLAALPPASAGQAAPLPLAGPATSPSAPAEEIVYVDAPARAGRHGEHERKEHGERKGHDDHEEDDDD
jgi:hypothetical protein